MCSFPFSFPLCSIYDLLILYCFFPEASLTVYTENDLGQEEEKTKAGTYITLSLMLTGQSGQGKHHSSFQT